jgi:hypothetical protein
MEKEINKANKVTFFANKNEHPENTFNSHSSN